MESKRKVVVTPVNINELDLRIVTSLFALTTNRPRAYVIDRTAQFPHLYLADADQPDSTSELDIRQQYHLAPAVLLSKTQTPSNNAYVVKHPIVPSRLLALLDNIGIAQTAGDKPTETLTKNPLASVQNISRDNVTPPQASTLGTTPQPNQKRVLVVDDSPTICSQLCLVLKPYQVAVDVAVTGKEALANVVSQTYDLIFLDVMLPGADGYQVCKALRRYSTQKKTPVIMLTSKSSPFDRVKGSLAGCDTYLIKPVDEQVLHGVLKKYLAMPSGHQNISHALPSPST